MMVTQRCLSRNGLAGVKNSIYININIYIASHRVRGGRRDGSGEQRGCKTLVAQDLSLMSFAAQVEAAAVSQPLHPLA